MNVLKFGGTSVGSTENIKKVIQILDNYSKEDSLICVVSAVGGITDKLLKAGELAQNKNESYLAEYKLIKQIHLDILSELIPNQNEASKEYLESKLHALKSLLDGIYLINELSPKTSDKLVSFGEQLSSFIIAETMKSYGLNAVRKNSQELIITNSNFSKAEVNYTLTNHNIRDYFKKANQRITILPGFISTSESGEVTTLGRGGSDFTAAIVAAALQVNRLEI